MQGSCSQGKSIETSSCHNTHWRRDYILIFSTLAGSILYFGHIAISNIDVVVGQKAGQLFKEFNHLINQMMLGIVLSIIVVGILSRIPRDYVLSVLGRPGEKQGILRASVAGLILDLCSHGILVVGMRLYRSGASIGQVVAFLVASPWNSLSLTIILFSLIGVMWTLLFVLLSTVIAILSGIAFDLCEKRGILPANPNHYEVKQNFRFFQSIKKDIKAHQWKMMDLITIPQEGFKESIPIVKWIVFGALLSVVVRVFVDQEVFQGYFGPYMMGLGATLLVASVVEVCSEGSAPLAADFMHRAYAPGNSFTFLMAGVATDYTEIMAIKETTKSWKMSLFLPLIVVPQTLIVGIILNGVGL